MGVVLVDSNVILDVLTEDARWLPWSADALAQASERHVLVINPIIDAEISVRFERIEQLEEAVPSTLFRREPLPWKAGFLAGKCFLAYRRLDGSRRSPLPHFDIGAHAAVRSMSPLTRDATRYRSYFPTLSLIAP